MYGSTSETNLNTIDNITNEAFRIASGAFKTTPANSLYIICNEIPPDIRINYLSLIYYRKIRSQVSNPAFQQVVPVGYELLFRNKHVTPFSNKDAKFNRT